MGEKRPTQADKIAKMRRALEFYRDAFTSTPNQRYGGLEWKPTEALLEDCGNLALHALNFAEGEK